MASRGPAAQAARREFSELLNAKGHAVDNARLAVARLERAFAEGALQRTDDMAEALADLSIALQQSAGQKLGGKSAEAARFIGRRLERLLDDA
ncbi:hypothetical protein BH23CHL7_BH23CHL7_22220 [soil metagenome]